VSGAKTNPIGSLPFGSLRLMELANGKIDRARQIVDNGLRNIPLIEHLDGKTLYALGGVWRSIARMHMEDAQHPHRRASL